MTQTYNFTEKCIQVEQKNNHTKNIYFNGKSEIPTPGILISFLR